MYPLDSVKVGTSPMFVIEVGILICVAVEPLVKYIILSLSNVVEATIDIVEAMGSETYLYFQLGGSDFIARVNARTTAKMGDTVKFAFEPESLHLFDKETELLII